MSLKAQFFSSGAHGQVFHEKKAIRGGGIEKKWGIGR